MRPRTIRSPGSPPAESTGEPACEPRHGRTAVPPSITILSPAMTTVATSASSIVVSGTAQDNVGVAQVTWVEFHGRVGNGDRHEQLDHRADCAVRRHYDDPDLRD